MICRLTMVGGIPTTEERKAVNEYVKAIDPKCFYQTVMFGDGVFDFKNDTVKTVDEIRRVMKDMREKFGICWRHYNYREDSSTTLWDSKMEHMMGIRVWNSNFRYEHEPEHQEDLSFGI